MTTFPGLRDLLDQLDHRDLQVHLELYRMDPATMPNQRLFLALLEHLARQDQLGLKETLELLELPVTLVHLDHKVQLENLDQLAIPEKREHQDTMELLELLVNQELKAKEETLVTMAQMDFLVLQELLEKMAIPELLGPLVLRVKLAHQATHFHPKSLVHPAHLATQAKMELQAILVAPDPQAQLDQLVWKDLLANLARMAILVVLALKAKPELMAPQVLPAKMDIPEQTVKCPALLDLKDLLAALVTTVLQAKMVCLALLVPLVKTDFPALLHTQLAHLENREDQAKMDMLAQQELLVIRVAQAPPDRKVNVALLDTLVLQDQLVL